MTLQKLEEWSISSDGPSLSKLPHFSFQETTEVMFNLPIVCYAKPNKHSVVWY